MSRQVVFERIGRNHHVSPLPLVDDADPEVCPTCGKSLAVWPAAECETPEEHSAATYDCECGDTVRHGPGSRSVVSYNSRGITLGRSRGRRMNLTGRATAEGTARWRRDHAEPLAPGRGYCVMCWRPFALRDGFPFRHGCRPFPAVVLHGPVRPPASREKARRVVTHAPGVYSDGKTRCGEVSAQLSEDEPTCQNCLRRLAHDVRAIV